MQRIASKTRRGRKRASSSGPSISWSVSGQVLTIMAVVLCLFPLTSLALNWGDPCNPAGNKYVNSAFTEVCGNSMLACANNFSCAYRSCSNSDYNPSWEIAFYPLPHRCSQNVSFCPDNGLDCLPLISNGQSCPYARDDACQGSDSKGANAICLNSTCAIKGVAPGGWCDVDAASYYFNYKNVNDSLQTIERDNCTLGYFCDTSDQLNKHCVPAASIGGVCNQDRQCISNSCNNDGTGGSGYCDNPPDSFKEVPLWTWIVIGVCILVFMLLTLLGLWLLHRWQSNREHEKIRRFYEVQEIFRQQNESQLADTREGSIILGTPIIYGQKNASSASVSSPNPNARVSMVSINGANGANGLNAPNTARFSDHRLSDYDSYVVPGGERPPPPTTETAEEYKARQIGETSGSNLSPGVGIPPRVPSAGSFRTSHPLMNEVGAGAVASGSQPVRVNNGNYDGLMMRGPRNGPGGENQNPDQ